MKTTFSYDYMMAHRGCYSADQVEKLFFEYCKEDIPLEAIVHCNIPIKHKFWFICKKTGLTIAQNQHIAISVAEIVLPLYEKSHPKNKAPREAIEAEKQYIAGHISLEKLLEKRAAANAYAVAVYADDYASGAAIAAAVYVGAHGDVYASADYADDYADADTRYKLQELLNNLLKPLITQSC